MNAKEGKISKIDLGNLHKDKGSEKSQLLCGASKAVNE